MLELWIKKRGNYYWVIETGAVVDSCEASIKGTGASCGRNKVLRWRLCKHSYKASQVLGKKCGIFPLIIVEIDTKFTMTFEWYGTSLLAPAPVMGWKENFLHVCSQKCGTRK